MAVLDQEHTDRYSIYNGDCIAVMQDLPPESIHLSIYSPPFCALYTYSNDLRDLSNSRNYEEFMAHYELVVAEISRITKPGRCTAVHAMDIPDSCNVGNFLSDFPRRHHPNAPTARLQIRRTSSHLERASGRPTPHDGEGLGSQDHLRRLLSLRCRGSRLPPHVPQGRKE